MKLYANQISFKIIRFLILSFSLFQFSSCEKALEPEFPDFLIKDDEIFENASTIDAAIANIYSGIRDNSPVTGNPGGLNVLLGLYTDELQYYLVASQIDNAFYNHFVLPNNSAVADFWNNSYALIFSANTIIEGLPNSSISDTEKEHFMGEALFLRAYLHFNITQLYGDIPYIKTTDYNVNGSVNRMPLEVIYNSMEEDLNIAKSLLPEMDSSGERLRVSKGVASAMLARMYLYTEQWEKAYTESNSVIINGNYIWQPDLNQVFIKDSPSTIWQLKPEYEGSGTQEGDTFIFDFGPPYLYALTDIFIMDFEMGDLRKEAWTREISDGTESWYHPYKYKQNYFDGSSTEYSILFRLAEQYLIRSEALLHLGNLQEAKDDINIIRFRSGLPPTNANNQEDVMTELVHQRRYELFTEQGHRWFDLKRLGMADLILEPIKVGWQSTDVLFPLPLRELLLNPNLNPQNPGY